MLESRWLALIAICLGVVMIVLDGTVVTVALPLIRTDLGFTQVSLVWLINAYILTFGGSVLLGGRLGDLYGARRVFLLGIAAFTVASLVCGLATSQAAMIGARALQGIGGAIVNATSLSLITNAFIETGERAKAMGIYGFIVSAGATLGILLGGLITSFFDWHWIFLINIPYGMLVLVLCLKVVPTARTERAAPARLDIGGSVTLTGSLMLAVYGIINGDDAGWFSSRSFATFGVALLLLAAFIWIESRVRDPLMPLELLRRRSLVLTNITATMATAASSTNDPRNGVANMSLPQRDIAGPRKPPTMPPASTSEMARALVAGEDTSAAAKRYCSPIALYTPITAVAAQ